MSPLCFTLRHNALTFDWELVEDTGARAVVHYLTRNAACADVAIDAQVLRRVPPCAFMGPTVATRPSGRSRPELSRAYCA